MCDCFHLAFPNWHAASAGTGAGRRLRGPETASENSSIYEEPSQFTEGERPRPQGSSPVEEFPESAKYAYSGKEGEAEHDPQHKSGHKTKKSGLGSMFERRSTPKMSKLKEVPSPEAGVIVKTPKDGCAEGLIYGGGGKDGIFIKEVLPESPASKNLKVKEGDQILSATVYFDNVSYEDAIQILEHAQAYKVKLCLKRKPDLTESEPAITSDVILEEDDETAEMREEGKTKRRGEARISWPKFPSFGKGKKSRFTRSHSSSEADEQRKLELSPTTSETDSPIKSQDTLKGKKKSKIKLSGLTKRSRISSSEDQDTDAPTTGEISGDIHQKKDSDKISPECLEVPSEETTKVIATEDIKAVKDIRSEENNQTDGQSVQHKVELISIDSTLKTTDLTVALADQESPSGTKSLDKKKKKKEKSELKLKILGKDKSKDKSSKDGKAKSSPKRLKTLGASLETEDQAKMEKSGVTSNFESDTKPQGDPPAPDTKNLILPEVEVNIVDAAFQEKSAQKGKDMKQKQETEAGKTFKLPEIGLSDNTIKENIQKVNAEVPTEGTKVSSETVSKITVSTTQLPKREDIVIPGMEDKSAKGIKQTKTKFKGHHEDIQAETVQLSIDVESVKEAVSKLPGFKLPQVDTTGMPIPEEITVIDANAQRISVKTPTKVSENKSKHASPQAKFDITASPEISLTTGQLPQLTSDDMIAEELLTETRVDLKKTQKEHETKIKKIFKREDITIPGKETPQEASTFTLVTVSEDVKFDSDSTATKEPHKKSKLPKISIPRLPDIGIDLPKHKSQQKDFQSETEIRKGKETEGAIGDVKTFETTDRLAAKKDGGITGYDVVREGKPMTDIPFIDIRSEGKEQTTGQVELGEVPSDISENMPSREQDVNIDGARVKTPQREGKIGKFKLPHLDISMPKVKGPKIDLNTSKKDVTVTLAKTKAEVQMPESPETDVILETGYDDNAEQQIEEKKKKLEITPLETQSEYDGQGSKFKIPKLGIKMPKMKGPEFDVSFSRKDDDVKVPDASASGTTKVQLPEVCESDGSFGTVDVNISDQKIEIEKSEVELKTLEGQSELDAQGGKFRMPKFGIKMPKIKGPEFDLHMSKRDANRSPQEKIEVQLPEAPEVDVNLGQMEVSIQEQKMEVDTPQMEIKSLQTKSEPDAQGGKFQMPKFGIKMPKIKGPEFDLHMSKKDANRSPQEKNEVQLPDAPEVDVNLGQMEVSIPEQKTEVDTPQMEIKSLHAGGELDAQGSKFKMPKFGIKMPKLRGPEFDLHVSKKDTDKLLQEKAEVHLPDAPEVDVNLGQMEVSIQEQKMEVEIPQMEIKSLQAGGELDAQGSKFKMPKFGIKMPKLKGPEFDLHVSKKDTDKLLQEKAEVHLPEAPEVDVNLGQMEVSIQEQKMEVEIPQMEIKSLQAGGELDAQGSKFKMPKFGIKMPKLKGPEFDLHVSKKDTDKLSQEKAEVQLPEAPEVDVNLGQMEVSIPEQKMEVDTPQMEIKSLKAGGELDAQGGKFKMPKFGIKMPKIKLPELDITLSTKEADVTLPEVEAEVQLPDVPDASVGLDVSVPEQKMGLEKPEVEIKTLPSKGELDGQEHKFKMPKFGITMPKTKGPEMDLSLSKKDEDMAHPAPSVDVEGPSVDKKTTEIEHELKGGKFKMPNLGFSLPKAKGPKLDLSISKKETDIMLPDIKADVKIPKVDLEKAPIEDKTPELEMQALEIEGQLINQEEKIKVPKSGIKMAKSKGPEFNLGLPTKAIKIKKTTKKEIKLPDVEPKVPATTVEILTPEIEVKETNLSISKKEMEKTLRDAKAEVKIPEASKTDISLGKAVIPEGKGEVEKPDVQIKPLQTHGKFEGQGSKFKMPKLGITVPKAKGPEIDLNFSKTDADVTLEEAKMPDTELKEAEIKAPEIQLQLSPVEQSSSKFKLPMFKLPKFKAPVADAPDIDQEMQVEEATIQMNTDGANVDIVAKDIDIQDQSFKVKSTLTGDEDGQRKFKMKKFGISFPKVQGPELDVQLSETPEMKVNFGTVDTSVAEVNIETEKPDMKMKPLQPDAEIAAHIEPQVAGVKESPSKFKMPTFKFPKFGATTPNVSGEVPDTEKGIKMDGSNVQVQTLHTDIDVPQVKAEIHMPEVDVKEPLSIALTEQQQNVEVDAKQKKTRFTMPKFSFSKPSIKASEGDISFPDKNVDISEVKVEVKGGNMAVKSPEITMPETDLKLSKKDGAVTLTDVDITLANVELTKPSIELETEASEIKLVTKEGDLTPSKFKMPTFKLPKFGGGTPSTTVELPVADKDIKIDGADIKIPEEVLTVTIVQPSTDGEVDLNLPKTDVDVTLPSAKIEMKLTDAELKKPSAEKESKAPEIKVVAKDTERSPLKFKMPTFKLPKFGAGSPSSTVEQSSVEKDVKIDGAEAKIPEGVLTIIAEAPTFDTDVPPVDIKMTETEHEAKMLLPNIGLSVPQAKETDIDLNISNKDRNISLLEAKTEVKLTGAEMKKTAEADIKTPEIKVTKKDKEGSPSKYKMPTFKLPKFGLGTSATAEVPIVETAVKKEGGETQISEQVLAVTIDAPSIDSKGPSIDIKTTGIEQEGKGSKVKLSSLSVSVPKAEMSDADVTLPELKGEVGVTDELKQTSVDINAPEIKVSTKNTEGSPSKFKMPTFKLPKFGLGKSTPVEVPIAETDVKIEGAGTQNSEEVLAVIVDTPIIEIEAPSIDIKGAGTGHEGKGSKFKLPSLSVSVPDAKGPDADLGLLKSDTDVTLPEAKVESKTISAEIEVKASEIKLATKDTEGTPSKFKMPTFKLPKFGLSSNAEVPFVETDVKAEGVETKISEEVLAVTIEATSIESKGPSTNIKSTGIEHEGQESKFKLPSLGFSMSQGKADADLSLSKADVDVTLPEVKAEVKVPETTAEVEMNVPEMKVVTKDMEVSSSKFKMPTFKLPKFGVSSNAEVPTLEKDVKTAEDEIKISEQVLAVTIDAPSIENEGPSLEIKTAGTEQEGKESKFKLPSLGFSVRQTKGPDADLSISKADADVTIPEVKTDVSLPETELKRLSATVDSKVPGIDIDESNTEGSSSSKFKMPTLKLPKVGGSGLQASVEVPAMDKKMKVDGEGLKVEDLKAEVKSLDVEINESMSVSDVPIIEGDKVKKTSWTLPRFSFSKTSSKTPDADINLEADLAIPDTKMDVHPPDIDIKESLTTSTDGATATDLDAKLKKPRFSLPRFSFSKQNTKEPDVEVSQLIVDVSLPEEKEDVKELHTEVKPPECESELEGQDGKFKMPVPGITIPKVKGLTFSKKDADITQTVSVEASPSTPKVPTITLASLEAATPQFSVEHDKGVEAEIGIKDKHMKGKGGEPKKCVDVTLPEDNLPKAEIKEEDGPVSVPDVPTAEVDKLKRPSWAFPRFSFSRTGAKTPDVDSNLQTPKVDGTSPETKAVYLPDAGAKEPSGATPVEECPAAELDTSIKKPKFSLPRFSFSKSSLKEPEVKAEPPQAGDDVQESPGPEVHLIPSQKDIDVKLPEIKADVKLPKDKVRDDSADVEIKASETKDESKVVIGSPLKFKMPSLKMPTFGSASYDVTKEYSGEKVTDTDENVPEDTTVTVKCPDVDIKTDASTPAATDSETPKTETDGAAHGSPSKFKLPSFKMPRLSLSKSKPEEIPVDTEHKDDKLEMEGDSKGESISAKMSLTSFGDILKTIDVEFDVSKADNDERNLETSKELNVKYKPTTKDLEAKEKETKSKQDTTKSPEKAGWFKFPKFGLSSPSEPAKSSAKAEQRDEKSPVGGPSGEEVSPTCSVQSSDAFADISSTVTSEQVGLSLSSPTKVTVKYCDPSSATGLGDKHIDIITSTTRTELNPDIPNLPEKITILSSGLSSSSEDTLRLESGKIHVITSNIQATPEHATLLTDVQIPSARGLLLKSERHEAASWTAGDSLGGKSTVFERHVVRETSCEISETKERLVVTKQITHTFEPAEPISGDTALSLQQLKDSVHSEKMRFFDEAEK